MSEVDVVILAAGKGSRMKDDLSKPLHKVAGLPMLEWIAGQSGNLIRKI